MEEHIWLIPIVVGIVGLVYVCLQPSNEHYGVPTMKNLPPPPEKIEGSMEYTSPIDKIRMIRDPQWSCKYVKREGESCTLNNNCRYPNCNNVKNEDQPRR